MYCHLQPQNYLRKYLDFKTNDLRNSTMTHCQKLLRVPSAPAGQGAPPLPVMVSRSSWPLCAAQVYSISSGAASGFLGIFQGNHLVLTTSVLTTEGDLISMVLAGVRSITSTYRQLYHPDRECSWVVASRSDSRSTRGLVRGALAV
jgi:hypothetical protein